MDDPGTPRARLELGAARLRNQQKTLDVAKDLTTITDFIVGLSENPAQVAKYRQSPDVVLAELGIAEDLRSVILAGDRYIQGRLGAKGDDNTVTVVVVVVVVI